MAVNDSDGIEADKSNIVVLKFGSSVLRNEGDLPRVVHEIYRWWRQGAQVLAVVSAFGNTTDELLRRAETICDQPEQSALAALLATGEAVSSSLLALALGRSGIPARVLDPAQAGLRTIGGRLDADLIAVDIEYLRAELRHSIVVLPGFIGRGERGETTLLGRGGSDFSAVFLAHRLRGRCVLLKDVDGIYASDPATSATPPLRFVKLKYGTASDLASGVVQRKAIRFAAAHGTPITVTSIGSDHETTIGSGADLLTVPQSTPAPLRVALLGCGVVGGGVYQALTALPEFFEIVGVGVRTGARSRAVGVPQQLITNDLVALIERPCDLVVELIGGTKPAGEFVARALELGRHVVTANKALMALAGERLAALADDNGVTLQYSAAVGGVLPALETIEREHRRGPLKSFCGVLNGTSNFVLDRLAGGDDLESAVSAAQAAGYAEANWRVDLDGTDAAEKMILLARKAFGVSLQFDDIERESIEHIDVNWLRDTCSRGRAVRFVASCRRERDGFKAGIKLTELPADHPLASTAGAENRLLIEPEFGAPFLVCGRGAGRWPTTEAVLADLLDIRREALLLDIDLSEKCEERA